MYFAIVRKAVKKKKTLGGAAAIAGHVMISVEQT
jgi:hypothetical protein